MVYGGVVLTFIISRSPSVLEHGQFTFVQVLMAEALAGRVSEFALFKAENLSSDRSLLTVWRWPRLCEVGRRGAAGVRKEVCGLERCEPEGRSTTCEGQERGEGSEE